MLATSYSDEGIEEDESRLVVVYKRYIRHVVKACMHEATKRQIQPGKLWSDATDTIISSVSIVTSKCCGYCKVHNTPGEVSRGLERYGSFF